MADILSCMVISLTLLSLFSLLCFSVPADFVIQFKVRGFLVDARAKDIFSSSGDSRLLTALREPISAFPSSSGGQDFHSLLGGSGCHSVWPWMAARGTAIVLPPQAKLHCGDVWAVPIASQKSCGCGRCGLLSMEMRFLPKTELMS